MGVFYTNPPEEDEFVCVLTSIWATWNPSFISNYERRWTGVSVDNSASAADLGCFYAPAARGDTFSRDYKPDKWQWNRIKSLCDVLFVFLSTVFLTIQFVTYVVVAPTWIYFGNVFIQNKLSWSTFIRSNHCGDWILTVVIMTTFSLLFIHEHVKNNSLGFSKGIMQVEVCISS